MAEPTEHPEALRMVVVVLRHLARLTQSELGRAAGTSQSQISLMEAGEVTPSEDALRRIASAAGVSWALVVHLRQYFTSFLSVLEHGMTDSPETGAFQEADLLAISSYLLEDMETRSESPSDARLMAERFWQGLAGRSSGRRRRAIELSPRASRSWALAERLCRESERAAAANPVEALELAELALSIAEKVEGKEAWSRRLQGYAWAHVGNARRVANGHMEADSAFSTAWKLWRSGASLESIFLEEWRMLSMEASLRRGERRFGDALALLTRAAQAVGTDLTARGVILLNRAFVCEVMGDLEGALAALSEAAPYVETTGDPRLLFALRFETAKALCNLERPTEASALLPEVRELAGRLGNELDLIRVEWLEARLAAGTGRHEEAIALLEGVRKRFAGQGLPFDAALASLELAVLYLKAGRMGEVKELARELTEVFRVQGIAREALAALTLFSEAAQRETATVELVRRVIEKVEGARRELPPRETGSSR
jgi:transcriptional regulator with XRE-family HTH domain/tetratricopeptide (TPR) repeat protein